MLNQFVQVNNFVGPGSHPHHASARMPLGPADHNTMESPWSNHFRTRSRLLPTFASKIIDGLFLGTADSSQDVTFLESNKISYIINCVGQTYPNFMARFGYNYLTFRFPDVAGVQVFDPQGKRVEQIYNFVENAHHHGCAVLVHSTHGDSRGCAVVMAYFMRKFNWTLKKAYTFVRYRRLTVNPKPHILRQLRDSAMSLGLHPGAVVSPDENVTDWVQPAVDPTDEVIRNTVGIRFHRIVATPVLIEVCPRAREQLLNALGVSLVNSITRRPTTKAKKLTWADHHDLPLHSPSQADLTSRASDQKHSPQQRGTSPATVKLVGLKQAYRSLSRSIRKQSPMKHHSNSHVAAPVSVKPAYDMQSTLEDLSRDYYTRKNSSIKRAWAVDTQKTPQQQHLNSVRRDSASSIEGRDESPWTSNSVSNERQRPADKVYRAGSPVARSRPSRGKDQGSGRAQHVPPAAHQRQMYKSHKSAPRIAVIRSQPSSASKRPPSPQLRTFHMPRGFTPVTSGSSNAGMGGQAGAAPVQRRQRSRPSSTKSLPKRRPSKSRPKSSRKASEQDGSRFTQTMSRSWSFRSEVLRSHAKTEGYSSSGVLSSPTFMISSMRLEPRKSTYERKATF